MRASILACAILLLVPAMASADEPTASTTMTTTTVKTKLASPALMGTGIAVASVGLTAMPFAILLASSHECYYPSTPANAGCQNKWESLQNFGIASVVGSSLFLIGGVTMIVFGAKRVPAVAIAPSGPSGSAGGTLSFSF